MNPTDPDVSAPPRVVMVVRLFRPWMGGTEIQAQTLAREMKARGVDVRIVTGWWFRGTPRREVVDGVPVFRHHTLWEFFGIRGLRKFGGYLYMVTLAAHLWRTRASYDVIHVHGMNYHSAVAVRIGHRLGKPTLTKLANSGAASDVDKMREDRQLWGSRFLLASALGSDRFVALNSAVVEELTSAGVPVDRIESIPNGVALGSVAPKETYSLDDPARVVFVGRLHRQKGLDTLIDAAERLHRSRSGRVRIELLGDGPERAALEAQIARLGVGERVELAGQVDDVSAVLRAANVFVLPSRAEGLSNALLEAMAHGLPVVVSDIPANLDVIRDGVDGLTFPLGDPDALAERIDRLLADAQLRARLGREARRSVETGYALPRVVDAYLDLYAHLTAPPVPAEVG